MPRSGNAILNDEDIPGLRHRLRTSQTTPKEEADRFGVGIETIRRAARGETFRHIREGLAEEDAPTPAPIIAPSSPPPAATLSPELADEVAESIRRVREAAAAPAEQKDAVDEFLTIRKHEGGEKE